MKHVRLQETYRSLLTFGLEIQTTVVVLHQPVSSVVKHMLSVREVWGLIPRLVKSATCR